MGANQSTFHAVVIGETGSGKTSLLNLIANLRKIAQMNEKEDLTLKMVRHLHIQAKTDQNANQGQSQTDKAFAHKIPDLGFNLVLIDTPGFGDTRGVDKDIAHVKNIEKAVESCDSINCILLVINGAVARMTPQLRYVLAQVTALMPQSILDQITVVLTNVVDPLDLNFDMTQLIEFFGKPVPPNHVIMINNPYAKLSKVLNAEEGIQRAALKRIKAGFKETYTEIVELFQEIVKFPPIGTHKFQEVYKARQDIEMSITKLQTELAAIAEKKNRIQQLEKEVADSESTLASLSGSMKVQTWEDTPGVHHMICRTCHKTCHHKCNVPFGRGKTETFKDCECFQWKKKKNIRITNESERQMVLANVFDSNIHTVSSEPPYAKTGECQRLRSIKNFSIKGVDVRGDPVRQWTTSAFYTDADCYESEIQKSTISYTSLPYEFQMNDWSNVELGEGMKCKHCDCPLSNHIHQMSLPTWTENKLFTQAGYEKQTKETSVAACQKEMESMRRKEEEIKNQLRKSLEAFSKNAISSSYVAFLNEQLSYLHILLTNKKQACDHTGVDNIQSQIRMIETMKAGTVATQTDCLIFSPAQVLQCW